MLSIDGQPVTFDLGTVQPGAVLAGEPMVRIRARPPVESTPDRNSTRFGSRAGRASRPASTSTGSCSATLRRGNRRRAETFTSRCSSTVGRRGPCASAPCPTGCWVVLGEGLNDGWVAEIHGDDSEDLGPGRLVDGGFNGWYLSPSGVPTDGDVQLDAAGHRHDRTVAEWSGGRHVHRTGRGHIGAATNSRPPVHRDWSGSVASDRRRGVRKWPDLRSPPPPGSSSPVRRGHWWRCPSRLGAVVLGRSRLLAAAALAIWLGCGAIVVWRVGALPTVPQRRMAGHVRGPAPSGHARARPARRFARDPDRRSEERSHGRSRGPRTDTCRGGHRAAPGSILAYS